MRTMISKAFQSKLRASAIAVCFFTTASLAHAATIDFGTTAFNISGDADVSTNGDLIFASNLGGVASTVNGVTFADDVDAADFSFTGLDNPNDGAFANTTAGSTFDMLSDGYQAVLQSGNFGGNTGADGAATLTLGNLTPGTNYEVQFFVNDSRSRTDFDLRSLLISGTDISLEYNVGGNGQNDGLGQFAVGTFTADAATQEIGFTSQRRQLNAIQLRSVSAVPEPGSLAILGLGSLLIIRRRRQSA